MEKREKADFLLEQVRLTSLERDFIRMGILANKLNKKLLEEEGMEDIRLRYYEQMIALHSAKKDALALSRDFFAVYSTRGVKDAGMEKWGPALESQALYLAMAPWEPEVQDLLLRLKEEKRTEELPSYRALLTYLTTEELIPWPLPEPHRSTLRAHKAFAGEAGAGAGAAGAGSSGDISMEEGGAAGGEEGASKPPSAAAVAAAAAVTGGAGPRITSSIVALEDEPRASWWQLLHKRIVQHNVRVISKCYTRIRSSRLSFLLGLDAATTEAVLSELVSSKHLYGRIDRPAGIVVFARPRPATEVMTEWSRDVDSVLNVLERTTHLIQKEYMVKGMAAGSRTGAAAARAGAGGAAAGGRA